MLKNSIFIIIFAGIPIIIYSILNEYDKIARWYYKNNKHYYILLQLSYWILMISMVLNVRFVVYTGIEFLTEKILKQKININM